MAKIEQAPGSSTAFVDIFPVPVTATRAPTSADTRFPLGQVWVRTDTAQAYTLCQLSSGAATWAISSPGASDVDTINSLSPAAGNIIIDGGTNLTDVNAGSTVTINMDAAITLATSVTSPLYTSAAGMAITAAAANDITIKMGDAVGAQKISFTDSADAEQASLDSDGTLTVVNMDGIIGATTPAAITGTTITANTSFVSPIFTSTGAVDTNINAVAGQDIIVKMGDAAAANKVSFVDSAAAEVASIDSNGAFTTTGLTFTGLLTANASATINTAGTALNLGTDNSGDAVNIGNGNVARAISIGTTAATAHTVSIGNATAGAITVDTAAGISLDAATDTNLTCSAATATAIIIEASDGAGGVQIKAGSAGILVGTDADTAVLSIGDIAPTASRTVTIGGGTVVTAAVTDTIDIGPDGATTNANSIKTVNVNTGTVATGQLLTNIASGTVTSGTHTTSIASGNRAAGTMALNIMTGTGTKTANIGNADGLTTVNALGTINLNASQNNNVNICSGTSTGTVTVGNTLATQIDLNAVALNIGTGAVEQAIVIGNTTAATNLTLTAGATGDITVNGTFKSLDAEFVQASGDDYIFQSSPMCLLSGNAPALPAGATGEVDLLTFPGLTMESFVIGAGQTIIAPVMDATGLLVSGDLTATEGFEYNWGGALATSRHAFTIGTSAAFFLEWKFTVADVSGGAPYMCGFRKAEANNATLTSYTDYAMIGIDAVANPDLITIKTELNSAGTTNTNTTDAWTDGQSHTMTILVSAAGVVTYLIDGVAPSVTAAYTFDNADVVVPFFRLEHQAGAPGAVHWETMKCGFQA